MLPPFEECQKRIEDFDRKYPNSTFDEFWGYKQKVEEMKGHSILDPPYLDGTVKLLREKLLDSREWGLARTGIPSDSMIKEILSKVARFYEKIRHSCLGQGSITEVRDELAQIYSELNGITHTNYRDSEPDEREGLYIVGKAKVLMFIWGQTTGFDRRVRKNFSFWTHAPAPYQLSHVRKSKKQYTPDEFCDIIEELDRRVIAWDEEHKKQGKTFQRLSPNRPVGRIIDIIYWIESKDC